GSSCHRINEGQIADFVAFLQGECVGQMNRGAPCDKYEFQPSEMNFLHDEDCDNSRGINNVAYGHVKPHEGKTDLRSFGEVVPDSMHERRNDNQCECKK